LEAAVRGDETVFTLGNLIVFTLGSSTDVQKKNGMQKVDRRHFPRPHPDGPVNLDTIPEWSLTSFSVPVAPSISHHISPKR
jgi:hypothetical protein